MKTSIYTTVLIAFIAGTILTSCNSQEEKTEAAKENMEKATENLDQAKEEYNAKFNEFKIEVEIQTARNEKAIIELKMQAKKLDKKERAKHEEAIDEMERQNKILKDKLDNYNGKGNEKWESFKRELNHDMEELGRSLKDLGNNNVK